MPENISQPLLKWDFCGWKMRGGGDIYLYNYRAPKVQPDHAAPRHNTYCISSDKFCQMPFVDSSVS
jgi:hypothetical protein